MAEAPIIGVDLAKRSVPLHGAAADGTLVFREKLPREWASVVPRRPAPDARGRGGVRERASPGPRDREARAQRAADPAHPREARRASDGRPMPRRRRPSARAASRPTMRFVAGKTAERQGQGTLLRKRALAGRASGPGRPTRSGAISPSSRIVAPRGPARVGRLAQAVDDGTVPLLETARELARLLLEPIAALGREDRGPREGHQAADVQIARLMSIPGIGAIGAIAVQAFCQSIAGATSRPGSA